MSSIGKLFRVLANILCVVRVCILLKKYHENFVKVFSGMTIMDQLIKQDGIN